MINCLNLKFILVFFAMKSKNMGRHYRKAGTCLTNLCHNSFIEGNLLDNETLIIEHQSRSVHTSKNNPQHGEWNQCFTNKEHTANGSIIYNSLNLAEILQHTMLVELAALVTPKSNSISNNGNEMDEYIARMFDKKARKDGFKRTTPEENPHAVLVVLRDVKKDMLGVCTGSLLTTRFVITAAYCFQTIYSDVALYAGGNSLAELQSGRLADGSQLRYTEPHQVHQHPTYTELHKAQFDVALVEVDHDFELSTKVNVIGLSLVYLQQGLYKACQLTGFGRLELTRGSAEDYTRKSHYLEVPSPCNCLTEGDQLQVICSKPKDDIGICSGDYGGGLVCNGKLVAIAMGVISLRNADCVLWSTRLQRCGMRPTVNIFQETCLFLNWINFYIALFNDTELDYGCQYKPHPDEVEHDDSYNGDSVTRIFCPSMIPLIISVLVLLVS